MKILNDLMRQSRLVNILTIVSVILCGLTILVACAAGIFSNERWTMTWTDTGTVITKTIEGNWWNWRGVARYKHTETFTLNSGDVTTDGMTAVRAYLTAITPVNQAYLIHENNFDRYHVVRKDNPLPHDLNYEYRGEVIYDISSLQIIFVLMTLPVFRFGAALVRRGRAAQRREALQASIETDVPTVAISRPGLRPNPIDQGVVSWRARCPHCNALIPRAWVWRASRREHNCIECNALLREDLTWRRGGNIALVALGLVALTFTINVVPAIFHSPGLALVAAICVVPAMGFLVYEVYPYITRFESTVPHCHGCGYNLTANTSGVCPECGTAVGLRSNS